MADANNVLIGLGGTGGKIVRSLRRAIYQNYPSEQPKGTTFVISTLADGETRQEKVLLTL